MTSLIDKALSCVGLMRVSEHLAKVDKIDNEAFTAWNTAKTASDEWEAKFKKAVTDLEKRDREVEALKADLAEREMLNHSLDAERNELIDLAAGRLEIINGMSVEILALRPDALLWRNARDKRAGKRGKANG